MKGKIESYLCVIIITKMSVSILKPNFKDRLEVDETISVFEAIRLWIQTRNNNSQIPSDSDVLYYLDCFRIVGTIDGRQDTILPEKYSEAIGNVASIRKDTNEKFIVTIQRLRS
jgi:hypothetical protein